MTASCPPLNYHMLSLIIIGILLIAIIAPALAIHHHIIHKDMPPSDGIPQLCFLQPSDVCADHCTHENWIILAILLAILFITLGLLTHN